MTKTLPLYEGARMCVRSGFCCKQAPCPFGTWSEEKHQCIHLQFNGKYECGIFDEIVNRSQKEWEIAPAFGAGCCSPLNSDRQAIIRRMREATSSANGNVSRIITKHTQ